MSDGAGRGRGGPGARPARSPLQRVVYWSLVAGVWVLIGGLVVLALFARGLPDTTRLEEPRKTPSISYLDRSGALLAVRGGPYAQPVDLDSLPAYVPAAFVAVEDRRFYHHWGFDLGGIVRSELYNLSHHGGPLRGGSTITQQLAKNLFLSPDQTFRRKVQELILSVELEWKYSKKQILSLYLNRVGFGAGAVGIEAASQRYFNKPAQKLSIGEAALLAGLLKAPTRYSPVNDQERAARRATIVLDEMVETGAITKAQEAEAFARPVTVSKTLSTQHAQYFVDWVDADVRRLVPDQVAGPDAKDLVVETTLDLPIDTAAESAARQVVERDRGLGVQQAALVAVDGEGRVRALIGGVDYGQSQFDRAVDSRRQAGSSWKPFVYLTAMENGRTPETPVVDEPVTIDGWTPKNYTGRYLGPITLATALAQSINTVAARLADEVGRQNVAAVARRLGITSPINTEPAMALGTTGVSPLEMAGAYDALSNGGVRAKPYGIERIRTADGRVLYEHHEADRTEVVGEPGLSYMVRMMRGVMTPPGTGARAAIAGFDLAGKTGTTSDYRDAWFVGFTGGFTTAVWVGRDDNTPMRKVTGGAAPAEIWRAFMSAALPRLRVAGIPSGVDPPAAAPVADDPVADLLNRTGENGEGGEVVGGAPRPPEPAPIDRSDDRVPPDPDYASPPAPYVRPARRPPPPADDADDDAPRAPRGYDPRYYDLPGSRPPPPPRDPYARPY